jgi:hypothetical protein
VECFKRIEDELPCYNQKGEAYFPATDKAKREELLKKKKTSAMVGATYPLVSTVSSTSSTVAENFNGPTGQPTNTGTTMGSVFPSRV